MALFKNSIITNILVAGSLLTGPLSAAAPSIAKKQEAGSNWKQFTSTKSGFNIDLPSSPEHIEQSIEIPQTNLSIEYNTYLSEPNESTVYVVSVWDYPKEIDMSDPKQNLQDGFGGMLSALPNAKVEFMELEKTQGFDSLEFLVRSDDIFFRGKLVLVYHTLYQVFTVYREGVEMEGDYKKFIESLNFTNPEKHENAENIQKVRA